jgi:hypothetical protein
MTTIATATAIPHIHPHRFTDARMHTRRAEGTATKQQH